MGLFPAQLKTNTTDIQDQILTYADLFQDRILTYADLFHLRPCSFVPDWWVGTISNRIASLIYINYD
jgi:hypothetical protein